MKVQILVSVFMLQFSIASHAQDLVFIRTVEKNLGQKIDVLVLDPKIKSMVSKNGFKVTSDSIKAVFYIKAIASTRGTSEYEGIYTSHADASLIILDIRTNDEIYNQSYLNVKSGGLNHKHAGMKALTKISSKIEADLNVLIASGKLRSSTVETAKVSVDRVEVKSEQTNSSSTTSNKANAEISKELEAVKEILAEVLEKQKAEAAEPQYRGSGDPLKGLNVAREKKMITGNYYALIIGIDKYKGIWTPLKNAVNDAKAVEAVLRSKYEFHHIKTLYDEDASGEKIISELEWLVANVKEEDNVFIYYSGHGEFKKELNKGYWVPADAPTSSTYKYISNSALQTFLSGIKSKHTLLVSDACFSGDIFRGKTISLPFENSEKYYAKVHNLESRQAITSGGIEPVMDGGRDGHSVFAYYFLKALKNNENKYYDAGQLYNELKIPVTNNSDQSPQLQPIKNTGDAGGQFVFIKK